MVSDSIQPLNSLKPVESEENTINDPTKKDYIEGREFYTAGDYPQAAISFHNALKGFEEQGDEQGIANAADRLGDTCLAREEYQFAIENYQRSMAICVKMDDSFSQLALNKKMALAYQKLGELEKALELLYDMMEHYRLVQNPQGVVDVLIIIGKIYVEQGEKEKAVDAYRTVSGIHKNFKHKRLAEEFAQRALELEQG